MQPTVMPPRGPSAVLGHLSPQGHVLSPGAHCIYRGVSSLQAPTVKHTSSSLMLPPTGCRQLLKSWRVVSCRAQVRQGTSLGAAAERDGEVSYYFQLESAYTCVHVRECAHNCVGGHYVLSYREITLNCWIQIASSIQCQHRSTYVMCPTTCDGHAL